MKTTTCIALMVLTCSTAMAATPRIDLRVSKKTVDRNKGSEQDLPRGSTTYKEQLIKYVIGVTSRSSRAPDAVLVEWAVLLEYPGGKIAEGERGSKAADLKLGRKTEVETGVITLGARSWSVRDRMHTDSGEVSTKVYGYGVRVVDEDENVLTEKYSKKDAQARIDWDKAVGLEKLLPEEPPFKDLLPRRKKRR